MNTPIASTTICQGDEVDCFTLSRPSKLILTGNSSASILYQGQEIGKLSTSNRTLDTCLAGEYCVRWAKGQCVDASIHVAECGGCEDLYMTVVDNGDGTVTGFNVDGTIVTWAKEDTFATITDNGDGSVTGTNVDGTTVTWDKEDTFATITDNGDGSITGTNVDGTTVTWDKADTFTTVTDDGNGCATITPPQGDPVVVSTVGFMVDGTGTALSGTGTKTDPWKVDSALCELPIASQADKDAATVKLVAGCLDNQQVLMPEQVGLPPIDPLYCVDIVIDGEPDFTPTPDNPMYMVPSGCDENGRATGFWIFTCADGWIKFEGNLPELSPIDINDVNEICDMQLWTRYFNDAECPVDRSITVDEFKQVLMQCICASIPTEATEATHAIDCVNGQFVRRPIIDEDENDQSTVSSNDDTVVVTESPNPDGTTNYDLSVPCPPLDGLLAFTTQPDGSQLSNDAVWVCDPSQPNGRARRQISIPAAEGCECTEFNAQVMAGGACFDMIGNGSRVFFHVNATNSPPFISNILGTSVVLGTPNLGATAMTYTNTNTYDVWVEMKYNFGMIVLESQGRNSVNVLQSLTAISGSGALPPDPSWGGAGAGYFDNNIAQDMAVAIPSPARNIDLVGNNNNWGYALGAEETRTVHFVPAGGSVTVDIDLYYSMDRLIVDEYLHIAIEGSWMAWGAK